MLIDEADPQIVQRAIEQYEALLAIEKLTPNKTNRSRNELLRSLPAAELIAVSVELERRGLLGGTR
jgi:hypothetical protein